MLVGVERGSLKKRDGGALARSDCASGQRSRLEGAGGSADAVRDDGYIHGRSEAYRWNQRRS